MASTRGRPYIVLLTRMDNTIRLDIVILPQIREPRELGQSRKLVKAKAQIFGAGLMDIGIIKHSVSPYQRENLDMANSTQSYHSPQPWSVYC